MSLSDRFWFPDFPSVNTAAVSTIFLVFEGQLSVDEVTDLIKERWLPRCAVKSQEIFPKLTREAVKVTADFYGWKEYEQFKLDDHVVEMDGKVTLDLAALNDFNLDTSEEISRGQRQLWRVSVLPKYSKTHDTGILLRMHASMADHLSFMRFTLESLHYKTVYLREDCFPFRRLCLCLCAVVAGPLLILQRLLMKRDTSLSTIPSPENDSPGFLSFLWSEAVDLKAANRIKDITRTKGNEYCGPYDNVISLRIKLKLRKWERVEIILSNSLLDFPGFSCVPFNNRKLWSIYYFSNHDVPCHVRVLILLRKISSCFQPIIFFGQFSITKPYKMSL